MRSLLRVRPERRSYPSATYHLRLIKVLAKRSVNLDGRVSTQYRIWSYVSPGKIPIGWQVLSSVECLQFSLVGGLLEGMDAVLLLSHHLKETPEGTRLKSGVDNTEFFRLHPCSAQAGVAGCM